MKHVKVLAFAGILLLMGACSTQPTLEEQFLANFNGYTKLDNPDPTERDILIEEGGRKLGDFRLSSAQSAKEATYKNVAFAAVLYKASFPTATTVIYNRVTYTLTK